MPLQNRVTPTGELIAVPERGLFYGNRGCLHDAEGNIKRFAANKRWIVCVLEFKGRRRSPLLRPGRFTELFFLDEATALAAGHRPCAECQRATYNQFRQAWAAGNRWDELPSADELDEALHAERWEGHGRRFVDVDVESLPIGAMFALDDQPYLVGREHCRSWTPGGYGTPEALPTGRVTLLTPPSTVEAIRQGYLPLLHPSAAAL
jgi:hypothetical protein